MEFNRDYKRRDSIVFNQPADWKVGYDLYGAAKFTQNADKKAVTF